MSDNESSNNKAKPTIFYAQKSQEDKSKRPYAKRDGDKSKPSGRGGYGKPSGDKPRSNRPRNENSRASDSRIETFKPRGQQSVSRDGDSPWKSRFQNTEQLPTFDADNKAPVVHEQIKRQRKEETLVYSENSCKAVFENRPETIIKAFFVQEKTYEFKSLIAHLVEHRLGYDVITDEQMTKIAQTPHHGGVCLIVKKRKAELVGDYLSKSAQVEQDCVLAIDDISNPHNLGGIARTAAFFGVGAMLLRQPDLLESGAALRVSEGGAESLTPVKADDLLASIDQFKQQGYQIVALLPCKVSSLKADTLTKVKMSRKTVFVIFQQINPKLATLADHCVYLPGSEAMSALNISVLTGILLAKWQENITNL